MEPHRTSSLLRNQQELGREAACQLPDDSPLHPNDEDLLRIASPRPLRQKEIRDRRASPTGRHGRSQSFQTQNLAGMELHIGPLENVKLFLRGP